MGTIRIQATIQDFDMPYVEKVLKDISAEEISFKTNYNEFPISKELELELEKRLENSKKNPEQGIFLEELKEKIISQRYDI